MTWAERLMRLASSDPAPALAARLVSLQQGFSQRAHRLEAHAQLAPTAGAERSLTALAARQAAAAEAIADTLRQRGVAPPAVPSNEPDGTESSHWARLATDLETGRAANAALLQQIPALLEDGPELAPLLESLRHGLDGLLRELRELIARADPHALN